MQFLVLEQAVPTLQHQSPAIWCDNIPAVAWIYKFRTSTSHLASHILLALATRLHKNQTGLLSVDHISGIYNTLADCASREHSTNPYTFLQIFTQKYTPPQGHSWTLFQFNNRTLSKISSVIQTQTSTMASWQQLSAKGTVFSVLGPDSSLTTSPGYPMTSEATVDRNSLLSWQPSQSLLEKEAFLAKNTKFAPKQSRWRYEPLPRRGNWKENLTSWQTRKDTIQKRLSYYCRGSNKRTHPSKPN